MGTCLDLALVAAGCLEQAGLHALVVMVQDHAFAGVWLDDASFPEACIEEPLRLRKRVDLHEIAVFDPTCLTQRPPCTTIGCNCVQKPWANLDCQFRLFHMLR